jgi:DNA polymerase III epsilon subunit-like protein
MAYQRPKRLDHLRFVQVQLLPDRKRRKVMAKTSGEEWQTEFEYIRPSSSGPATGPYWLAWIAVQVPNSGEAHSGADPEVQPTEAVTNTPSSRPQGKLKWGRERPPGAPGDRLVGRLGPPSIELASYHNPGHLMEPRESNPEDSQPPRVPLETELERISFVALDCETTGHFPDRMVELGAVRFHLSLPGTEEHPRALLESLVHTTDHINPYARRVHRISRSMLTGAPSLRRVALSFREFSKGSILVEHSADAFDTRLISRAMDRPPPHHHLDTSRMAGFLFQLRDTIGLERLCERLSVTHRQPHFALADAEATADCFVELVRLGQQEFGWKTLGDLVTVGMPPGPRPVTRPRRRDSSGSAPSPEGEAGAVPPTRSRRRHRAGRRRHPSTAPEPAAGSEASGT